MKLNYLLIVSLLLLFSTIGTASAVSEVNISGPVFNGTDLNEIIGLEDTDFIEMNAANFEGFISGEELIISGGANVDGRTINENGLVYTTEIEMVEFEGNFSDTDGVWNVTHYPLMGLFGEEYVPLKDVTPDKFATLLEDNNETFNLNIGQSLELAGGYELTLKDIDVMGTGVWLSFTKDGKLIEEEHIYVPEGGATWVLDEDIGDEDDVEVLRVHITEVSMDGINSSVVVKGLWLIDFENSFAIWTDDEFGNLELTAIGTNFLEFNNVNQITLTNGSIQTIGGGLKFEVADSDELRFNIFKDGTYSVSFDGVIEDEVFEGDSLELRGPVFEGYSLNEIIGPQETDYIEVNATNFAGFFYDPDNNVSTEVLRIYGGSNVYGRTIEEGGLVYTTTIEDVMFEDKFEGRDVYPVLGLFGEEYVPLGYNTPDKIAKLLEYNNDNHALRTGDALEIADGYEISAKSIYIDNNTVRMELSKDGYILADGLVNLTGKSNGATWVCNKDVAGEVDVEVMKVHIIDVSMDEMGSFAVIEGMWLIDFEGPLVIEQWDEFGDLEVNSITDTSLTMTNLYPITLYINSVQEIVDELYFKVADLDELRFYIFREATEPGTYEVHGEVVGGPASWDYSNFANFLFYLNDNISTENLVVESFDIDNMRLIPVGDLTYTTTIQEVEFEYWLGFDLYDYPVLGFFGEEYVPLKNTTPNKLARLVKDNDEEYYLKTGQSLDLGNGYAITPLLIDPENETVRMEFTNNGTLIADEIIDVSDSSYGGTTWIYNDSVANEENVDIIKVNLDYVFQGQVDNYVFIEGLWLIDAENPLVIQPGEKFGNLEVDSIGTTSLSMSNFAPVILTTDSIQDIGGNLKFRVADHPDELRYYPFVEEIIEEIPNKIPTAEIISVSPNPADEGTIVTFNGTGADADGTIVAYNWTSDIAGVLSESVNFSTSELSVGEHIITFKVQDDDGVWSQEISATVNINEISNEASTYTFSLNGSGQLLWSYENTQKDAWVSCTTLGDVNSDEICDVLIFDLNQNEELIAVSGFDGSVIWNKVYDDGSEVEVHEHIDANGDYVSDVIVKKSEYNETTDQTTTHIELLNGIDGSNIWDESINHTGDSLVISSYDFTGDGTEDLLLQPDGYTVYSETDGHIENGNQDFLCVLNGTDGSKLWNISGNSFSWYSDGDLTGDGINDVVVTDDDYVANTTEVSMIKGPYGTLEWNKSFIGEASDSLMDRYDSEYYDADGDGLLDSCVVITDVYNETTNFFVLKGTDGSVIWNKSFDGILSYGDVSFGFSLGDIDNDNINDMRFSFPQEIQILSGNDGSLIWNQSFESPVKCVNLNDIDGDGINDMRLSFSQEIQILSGNDGSLIWNSSFDSFSSIDNDSDLDGDDINDILLVDFYNLSTYEYNCNVSAISGVDGSLIWEYSYPFIVDAGNLENIECYNSSTTFTVSDLNGDGVLDPLLDIDVSFGTWDTPIYSKEKLICINGNDGSELWNAEFAVNGDHVGWNFVSWTNLNDDNIDDVVFGNVKGVYAFSTTDIIIPENNAVPTAQISSITPESVYAGDLVTFNGTGIDTDGAVVSYKWTSSIDGVLSETANFTTAELSVGEHTITFKVRDDDGEWSQPVSSSVTVSERPNVGPTAQIVSISPNPAAEGIVVTFNGTGVDSDGAIVAYKWSSNVTGLLSTSDNFTTSDLSLGTHTISFKVQDDDGEWSEEVSAILQIVDEIDPVVFINDVATPTNVSTQTITGSAAENNLASVTVNDVAAIVGDGSYSATIPLSEGENTINVVAVDTSGNTGSNTTSILLDTMAPEVTINSVTTPTNISSQLITGNVTDANLSSVTVNDVVAEVSGDGYSATIPLSEGENTITVVAVDIAGNTEFNTTAILVDITAPVVNIEATPEENVSVNNPVSITLNSTDAYPNSTEFIIKGDVVILEELVTEEVMDGADYTFVWNATDSEGQPVPSGDYLLFVNSTDTSGNTASKNVTVTVDNDEPTVSIDVIEGSRLVGDVMYTNSTLGVNVTASGTPGDAAEVEFILESDFTTFKKTINAELVEDFWTGTFDMSSIPDDGVYVLSATATDHAMNTNSTVSSIVVMLDRRSPLMSSTISRFNETHGLVNITSNEELAEMPVVEVNGNLSDLETIDGLWSGIFQLDGEAYSVNMSGIDLAGNIGVGSSKALIKTVTTSNGTGVLSNNETGTSITFRTTEDTDDVVTVTESSNPLANTTDDLVGVHFIDVELGDNLANKLANATIAIPVNEASLPSGVTADDVSIRYYNTTVDAWEKLDTEIQTIDGIDCWVAIVDHFSTYAAIADDTIAPVRDGVTPSNNHVFEKGTTSVEIRFNYSDAQTGINVSAIVFEFGTDDVTDNENTQITGEYALYNATNLTAGTYTAYVTVFDLAGNHEKFSTSFQIPAESGNIASSNNGGSSGSSSGGGGGGGSSGEAYENIAHKAVMSQYINKDADVSYEFDGEESSISHISFVSLKNSGTIKATVEVLNGRSSFAGTDAPGKVYQSMNIWVGKAGFATEQNIDNPTIGFKVEKSWLEENGIEISSIKLCRYNDDAWNPLPTEKTDEDDEYVYFEATTPGFSPFAITSITDSDIGVQEESSGQMGEETSANNSEEPKDSDESGSKDSPSLGIASVAGLLACAYLVRRNI